MKWQVEDQSLRVRIDEDELARLLEGQVLSSVSNFADAFSIGMTIAAVDASTPTLSGDAASWRMDLPVADLRQHAARLPSRHGLTYHLPGCTDAEALDVLFDVDVRDSVRRRRK